MGLWVRDRESADPNGSFNIPDCWANSSLFENDSVALFWVNGINAKIVSKSLSQEQ